MGPDARNVYFTPVHEELYNAYRGVSFEVMDVTFTHPNPLIPHLSLLYIRDDPGDPNNVISIGFDLIDPDMITFDRPPDQFIQPEEPPESQSYNLGLEEQEGTEEPQPRSRRVRRRI